LWIIGLYRNKTAGTGKTFSQLYVILPTKQTITFRNFRKSKINRQFLLKFSDGSTYNVDQEGSPFYHVSATIGNDPYIHSFFANSIIKGHDGKDVIYGTKYTDYIYGGAGNDYLHGGAGDDEIYGETGKDHLYGEAGNDKLFGGSGDDRLFGGSGSDYLDGGSGKNRLLGGDGSDTYIFETDISDSNAIGGYDHVTDLYGFNRIKFIDLTPDDIEVSRSGNNMVFTNKETKETLTIYIYNNTGENFYYQFGEKTYSLNTEGSSPEFVEDTYDSVYSRYLSSGKYNSRLEKLRKRHTDKNISDYTNSTVAQPPRDPLVIDVNRDNKVDLLAVDDPENRAYFDLDKNGFAEKTAWIGENDGFLVYDRNGNGKIDDSGEMFSDQVILSDGTLSGNGFRALADLNDYNDDRRNVINEKDSAFDSLKVWIDKGTDGKSEGELISLKELGIKEISLNHRKSEKDFPMLRLL